MKLMASGVTWSAARGEIALVFAVLVIDHDDHSAGTDLVECAGDVGEGGSEVRGDWGMMPSYFRLSVRERQNGA